jgi:hypothetical protein
MAKETTVANAPKNYSVAVKGFTYIKDWAFLTVSIENTIQRILIGTKSDFPMSEMFQLKQADSVELTERDPRTVNGVTYRNFRLESINF